MADVLKRDLNFNSENLPGAGAAGGLGAGAAAFLNAELRSGIDIVWTNSALTNLPRMPM